MYFAKFPSHWASFSSGSVQAMCAVQSFHVFCQNWDFSFITYFCLFAACSKWEQFHFCLILNTAGTSNQISNPRFCLKQDCCVELLVLHITRCYSSHLQKCLFKAGNAFCSSVSLQWSFHANRPAGWFFWPFRTSYLVSGTWDCNSTLYCSHKSKSFNGKKAAATCPSSLILFLWSHK